MGNETGQGLLSATSLSAESRSGSGKSIRRTKMLGWAGIGLCGLACALPFLGMLAGITFFTAIAVYLETFAILALGLAGVFFAYAYYQKKKKISSPPEGPSCEVDCGCSTKPAQEEGTKTEHHEPSKITDQAACDLSSLSKEDGERFIRSYKEMFLSVKEVHEIADGYALGFDGKSAGIISRLAEFIAYDRQCCSFLHHELRAEPYNGLIWLRLTGADGAKAHIRAELSGLLPVGKSLPKDGSILQEERN